MATDTLVVTEPSGLGHQSERQSVPLWNALLTCSCGCSQLPKPQVVPESLVRASMSIPGKPRLGVFEVALMLHQEVYRKSWGTLCKDLHVLFQNNPSLDLE